MEKTKKRNIILIMIVYLAGIFMGALDTGIVTPARTIIQNGFGVTEQTGIWMITIYTLAYASSIPIMGKLADRYGRKYVYLISILMFGVGSLFCGLSQQAGSFPMLIISRAFQAIGGGGILPVATAEFGTSFPKEKRGLALGLVGGVFGIANIFGATVGSTILDVFGADNWQYIFYVNVPITIFIIVVGLFVLKNNKVEQKEKIDGLGILTLVLMILSLLYGLNNLDFFNFGKTLIQTNVYPFLLAFLILIPLFVYIEKKAKEPVMNLTYFTDKNILAVLLLSFASGIVMMGMVFVPQFCENELKISAGNGGYLVMILGIFAGISSPLSGKLTDRYGPKKIIGWGFGIAALGSFFLIFLATAYPNWITVIISLCLIGFGMGFTMGSPLNYMMLENTDVKESNSALASASLVRSIGTTIAPAIMIGFIATAGASIQGNIMSLLPNEIHVPSLPYAKEINESLSQMKQNPQMQAQLSNINIPDLTAMNTIKIDMSKSGGKSTISPELLDKMKNSDVTTITDTAKEIADAMFTNMSKPMMNKIESGVQNGIDGISNAETQMQAAMNNMQGGMPHGQMPPQTGSMPSNPAIQAMASTANQLNTTKNQMQTLKKAVAPAFDTAKKNYMKDIDKKSAVLESTFQKTMNDGYKKVYLTSGIAAVIALLILSVYHSKDKEEKL